MAETEGLDGSTGDRTHLNPDAVDGFIRQVSGLIKGLEKQIPHGPAAYVGRGAAVSGSVEFARRNKAAVKAATDLTAKASVLCRDLRANSRKLLESVVDTDKENADRIGKD